eukprot:jgi/Mesvir1/16712/Mv15103-RA.1
MKLDKEAIACMGIGRVCKDNQGRINSLDFHPRENQLVTASDDASIHVYDTATGTLKKSLNSKKYGVSHICFTHHPENVIHASRNDWDDSIRYLSLYDNRYHRYFQGHRGRVTSLSMSPKDDLFMSGSLDGTVRLWDLRSTACQGLLRLQGRPSASFDHQGLVFAVTSQPGVLKLFDVRSYNKGPFDTFAVQTSASPSSSPAITSIKFSQDGKLILASTMESHHMVLDAYTGQTLQTFVSVQAPQGVDDAMGACFSPDGQFVLAGDGDRSIRVWETASGQEVASWGGHAGIPSVIKWAPRQMLVASACTALVLWIPDLSRLKRPQS